MPSALVTTKLTMKMKCLTLGVSLALGLGCADDPTPQRAPLMMVIPYPSYAGEIEVENRSQFPYTELYFHQERDVDLTTQENLLPEPLAPDELITLEVTDAQYITAIRPRVEEGPLWRVQSARPVVFYATPDEPTPRLWIVDQGFIVIDALSR